MVIGVTGGVGAGKSTILKILEEQFGAKLIMSDDVAKELMEPGGASYEAVVAAFGEEILAENSLDKMDQAYDKNAMDQASAVTGQALTNNPPIDRQKLAAIVFADDEKLTLLNSLTHPKVKEEILARIDAFYEEDPGALVIIEAALLIEAGYEDILDALWVVTADPEVRIERLMRSRGYTREKCLSIMDNQLSDDEFLLHADAVIDNSGTREESEEQLRGILESLS